MYFNFFFSIIFIFKVHFEKRKIKDVHFSHRKLIGNEKRKMLITK